MLGFEKNKKKTLGANYLHITQQNTENKPKTEKAYSCGRNRGELWGRSSISEWGGGGVKRRKKNSMKNIGIKVLITNRIMIKLQTNKKQKTSNNKHEQPTLKLDKSQGKKKKEKEVIPKIMSRQL